MFLPNEYEDLKIGGIYNKGGILVFQGKFSWRRDDQIKNRSMKDCAKTRSRFSDLGIKM
jgi:hypothetical protein